MLLPSVDHEVHSPVRVDATLGNDEDLDRNPDGIPHSVIGLTALVSVLLACILAVLLFAGTLGRLAAVALALVAIPWLVFRLNSKADRDRDHVHPSR